MLKCRGYNPCPEHVSPVTTEGMNTSNSLPAEKPGITELTESEKEDGQVVKEYRDSQ